MIKKYLNYIWPFFVIQLTSLLIVLTFCNYVILIPSAFWIYLISFSVGMMFFLFFGKFLVNPKWYARVILLILFLASIGVIPIIGREIGDKAIESIQPTPQ